MEIKDMTLDNNKITISFNSKEKEYLYDSLCYRYILARKQMAEYERFKGGCSNNFYDKQANRDIMRFCQILDEAIGEHN